MTKKLKLTDKVAKTAALPKSGETILWDADLAGFGLRLRASGGRSWFVKKGSTRLALGVATERTAADARAEALHTLSELAAGRKPKRKVRTAKPTVSDLMKAYLEEHVALRRTQSTLRDYQRVIDNHLLPRIGHRFVDDIEPRDVDRLLSDLRETPAAANKCAALLKAAMQRAMRWGIRMPALGNPCAGAEFHTAEPHEEFLEGWELRILLEALDEVGVQPNRWHAAQCLKLLAVSGCRRDEVRALQWAWVDWDRGRIDWPSTKTGQGHLVLNSAAIRILEEIRERDMGRFKPHVFVGLDRNLVLPKATLYRAWIDAKSLAAERGIDARRIERLRPHDLRHSFATLGLSHGLTLDDVGRLLRHRDKRSTARYARHLPSREAALAAQTTEFLPV